MKTIAVSILVIVCLVAGLVGCERSNPGPVFDEAAIAKHWEAVRHHREFVNNPDNFKPDASTGLVAVSPADPLPSLAALVAVDELQYVDLVFPTVPNTREVNQYWMTWGQRQSDVWYMIGNPQYVAYKPSGEQPLHLSIWFEESASAKVQQLIADLEMLAKDGN